MHGWEKWLEVLEDIESDPDRYEEISERHRNNRIIAKAAMVRPINLLFTGRVLRSDKQVVMIALSKASPVLCPYLYQHVSFRLKNDKDVLNLMREKQKQIFSGW